MTRSNSSRSLRPLAVITGSANGIGLHLARHAAADGYDLILAAEAPFDEAKRQLSAYPVEITTLELDLADLDSVDELYEAMDGRSPDVMCWNAEHGPGKRFLDQDIYDALDIVDTHISGTLYLLHRVGQDMRAAGEGRILITGSIARFAPGSFQAVHSGTKAFMDSFSSALRDELEHSGISMTCLLPSLADNDLFELAPEAVAEFGWNAMLNGEGDVIADLRRKPQRSLQLPPAETMR